jgi:hypothetical protein
MQFHKYAVHINGGFFDDKFRPQMLSVGTTANATLNSDGKQFH